MGKLTQAFTYEEINNQDLDSIACQPWRHGTRHTFVFEHDGKFWMFTADVHHDDGLQLDGLDGAILCTQVHQVEHVVKKWVPTRLDTVDTLQSKPIPSAWRKEPPTRDEVFACPWWWTRSASSALRVMKLLTCFDVADAIVHDDSGAGFHPEEWGHSADWAPCPPPPGSGK